MVAYVRVVPAEKRAQARPQIMRFLLLLLLVASFAVGPGAHQRPAVGDGHCEEGDALCAVVAGDGDHHNGAIGGGGTCCCHHHCCSAGFLVTVNNASRSFLLSSVVVPLAGVLMPLSGLGPEPPVPKRT